MRQILKAALKAYSKYRAKKRLTNKEFKVKYVDSILLSITKILPMPYEEQIRTDFLKKDKLERLIDKIKGFFSYECERIVVKRIRKNGRFQYILFDGHHRFHAFKKLGYTDIVVDVIVLDDDVTVEEILYFKWILNEDFPKAGNDPNDAIKVVGTTIKRKYKDSAKQSKVKKKQVKECFREFVKKTSERSGIIDTKTQEYILNKLFQIYSSHKNSNKHGDIRNWTVYNGVLPSNQHNDQTLIQNVVMGRNPNHPECALGYGGTEHHGDSGQVVSNKVYLNKTNNDIDHNLVWATYDAKFTKEYGTKDFKKPVIFLFYVNSDCNGDLTVLEMKRADIQKSFYNKRNTICDAKVNEYCENAKLLGKKVTEKQKAEIKKFYVSMAVNGGCVPALDTESGFVTSKGNPHSIDKKALYYVKN